MLAFALPLTMLLLGTQFIGQALPLPSINIADYEPTIMCMSNAYNNEQTAHKTDVALTLGDVLDWIDPSVGAVCDISGGIHPPQLPQPGPDAIRV